VAVTERGGDGCVGGGAVFDVAVVSKLIVVVIGVMVKIQGDEKR
jgi:hypothetical protein